MTNEEKLMTAVVANIDELCEKQSMSWKGLSVRSGIPYTTLIGLKYNCSVRHDHLIKIAEALGVTIARLTKIN